jgi:uncharacterized protein (TIGR03437 family)
MKYLCVFILGVVACVAADFTTGQAARGVIGQVTFTRGDPTASQTVIGGVGGLAYANDTLFVADSNRVSANPLNNRVLIYHNVSTLFPPPATEPPHQGSRCPVCGPQASLVLGQADFSKTDPAAGQNGFSLPTAVATDGQVLVVADTNNNRVLIWNSIPTSNNVPPDVVVGQSDFTTTSTLVPPTAKSLRGPQGVWIQNGRLFIADTQDHRVLIYKAIPTSSGAAADVVLGQPNFTTFVEPDLTQAKQDATADNLLNPVSVTSDGVRLYVTDLGHHRVLIWNSIPTQNQQPADLVLGQPNMTSAIPNYGFSGAPAATAGATGQESPVLCTVSNGTDANSKPTYPALCSATLSFPRYALSDGTWLFIADGGNDRVLVYRQVPAANGAAADIILGQPDGLTDVSGDGTDQVATPLSLAWTGQDLFVSDPYNRRVAVFTPAETSIPLTGVRNAASLDIFAVGTVTFSGTIHADDQVTVTIGGKAYTYKVVKNDTMGNIVTTLVGTINAGAGDPNVIAVADTTTASVHLTARKSGAPGNVVTLSTTLSSGAQLVATASGATLSGGQNAAQVGPASLITIFGSNLSDGTGIEPGTGHYAPNEIAGTRVYIDGNRVPLLYVSPTVINAQMPIAYADTTSVSLYVRTRHADGTVTATTAVPVTIIPENPGIFAMGGNDPRPGVVYHGSPYASGTVSVDGSINAGDVGTITIETRPYTYTVKTGDTLETVRDGLVAAVSKDPKVTAEVAGAFTRVRLRARAAGAAGVGIKYTASVNSAAKLLLTATTGALCCPNTGPATTANPAIPGETIVVYATGLGLVTPATPAFATGRRYDGPITAQPVEFVSSLAGGKTANVITANPLPGSIGVFEVHLELNSDLPTDPLTQLTIAQSVYLSNIITFPVKK